MILNSNGAHSSRPSIQQTERDQSAGHVKSNLMIELCSVRFFTGLEKSETRVILAAATQRKLKGGEIVARADEPASNLFLVKNGLIDYFVITSDGREILLRRLVSGNIFEWAHFFPTPQAMSAHPNRSITVKYLCGGIRLFASSRKHIRCLPKTPCVPYCGTLPCSRKGTSRL